MVSESSVLVFKSNNCGVRAESVDSGDTLAQATIIVLYNDRGV